MEIASLCFYLFSGLTLLSALAVISARNSVHSVLFLIFCFFNAAGLFVLLGAEYVAMTLVIVYVGAVAVLFLFVVMMLNVDTSAVQAKFHRHLPLGLLLALFLFGELAILFLALTKNTPLIGEVRYATPSPDSVSNTEAIGQILYTEFIYAFQVSGLILLVAMICAIVLTLRQQKVSFKQNVAIQQNRRRSESVKLVNVKPGQGAR